jgi:hypothetical protein
MLTLSLSLLPGRIIAEELLQWARRLHDSHPLEEDVITFSGMYLNGKPTTKDKVNDLTCSPKPSGMLTFIIK